MRERGTVIININGFPNLYGYAEQHNFALIPEDTAPNLISLGTDYVTPLRYRLRTALDQHVALAPNRKSWIEVQRETTSTFFPETQYFPIFVSPSFLASGRLLACVETDSRPWWVECNVLPDTEYHRRIVLQVWELAKNWLIPLAPFLERKISTLEAGPVTFRLKFPEISTLSQQVTCTENAPSPDVTKDEHGATVICGPQYLRSFANAKNIGDRLMITALIKATYAIANVGAPDPATLDAMVAEIVQTDDARFFHSIPAQTLREKIYAAVPLPKPRLQSLEDRAWSRLDIARQAGWKSAPGPIPPSQAGKVLNNAASVVWGRIKTRLLCLDRASVIAMALSNHDAIESDRMSWRFTAAALLALHKNTDDVINGKRPGTTALRR